MRDLQNPLLPAGYAIAWSTIAALTIGLVLVALISLARSARRLTSAQALGWTLVTLLVPVLGPIAWLSIGRRAASTERARQQT